MQNIKLEDKINLLPDAPGVYFFKDKTGQIIYIGKAKSLKKRVQSYFNRPVDIKTQAMVSKISDLEYRLTSSEAKAEILEAVLVKDKQPQYNIDLKDDKSFPLIKITNEQFPIISICRRKAPKPDDKALYFGPYTDAKLLRYLYKIIRKIFGFRSCRKLPKQSCLYHQLKLCPAPCTGKISAKEYQEIIGKVRMFLESKYEELINKLTRDMQLAAGKNLFERAARVRDQINALSLIRQNKPYSAAGTSEIDGLKDLLKLDKLPQRIEAFDISNIAGRQATGSMVSFYQGLPDKNNYRRFRIKTVMQINDYRMLREVIERRYSRLKKESLTMPDLILIDGGRSHLLVAEKVLKKLGLKIAIVSIAKDKENIYSYKQAFPIRLKSDTPALNLIRRIRDEAHRFALKYHHLLRRKKILGK